MSEVSSERRGFIPYPTNRVIGTIRDADKAKAAVDALLQAGFGQEDVEMLHGEEDLKRLDPTGTGHGFLAQLQRRLIRAFELEEFKHLTHHVEDVRAGRFVIMVLAKRRAQRVAAADILYRFEAEFVGFHGRWALEEVSSSEQTRPEHIPGLFARAWNDRNPDALARLFDEDAQFVNVTGVCWHDRESIRKAHVDGLKPLATNSILAIDETTVKLLAPDIALVHSRMTLSDQPPGGAGQTGPRATIISFVVHRTIDRWLCASAHRTDVVAPDAATTVVGAANVFGVLEGQSGQAS